jgi:hypothetical protein
MYGKLQYSDKCSLPASIGRDLYRKPYELPWIFEVRRPSLLSPAEDAAEVESVDQVGRASTGVGQGLLERVYARYLFPLNSCSLLYIICYLQ